MAKVLVVDDHPINRNLIAKLVEKVRELEATERALGESVARFRSLAESCPLGILSLDSAAQVTYTNPRLQQITGIADHHLPRPIWSELLHLDDRDRVTGGLA